MNSRITLLDQLKHLHPIQFEEEIFRLTGDIDISYIPSSAVPQPVRAMELIKLLEQRPELLGYLQTRLNDFDSFNEFLPKGAYPVGQKLWEREEARERQDMEEAKARGEDPEDYRITPEKFYTFKPAADWLGIFRGWDAPRSFHSELLRRVVDASRGRNNCPAAAIIGQHGGSGKSVALRRLAVDLAEQGYKVWWVKHPAQLLQFGISEIADSGERPQFLLVDNVHRIDDVYIESFNEYLLDNRSLILVVAGRRLPNAFKVQVRHGSGLFNPYEADDRDLVLDKIAETIPKWADTAKKLKTEPLRKARLIRLLLVMARRKAAPRNLEELETLFLKIVADDISTIRATLPGLADAVIDAAAIREVGRDISRATFIVLADYRQPGASITTLLEDVSGNQRWKVLESLVSHDSEYDTVQFHHDELADGIISAGQRDFLEPRIIIDNAWRRGVLDVVIGRGSVYSSSYALSGFVRNNPGIISQERTQEYIRQLLAAGNGHHAYMRLIIDEALDLEQREILELLLVAAQVAPLNAWLWTTVWGWIQRNYQKKEERCEILEQLYQARCKSHIILIPFLQYLPHEKACVVAKKLLTDNTTISSVLATCLNLLGDEATDDAKRLLAESNDPEVLCKSLKLLGEEAKPFAVEQIRCWTETDPALLVRCFQVAGATPEAGKAAEEMLTAWNKRVPPILRAVALRVPFDTPLRIQRAYEVLHNWRGEYRPLVGAALTAFWNDPDAVTEYCIAILRRWHQEIFYRHKHNRIAYDGHIIKALSHPALNDDAYYIAQKMLNAEAKSSGFLSPELRRQAENIIQGQGPIWAPYEDEISVHDPSGHP